MKVNLKLFAGLLTIGTVAAIVPTVLTSCKSEVKQHENSASFTFDAHHRDDTINNIKNFFNQQEFVFNPNPAGLTIGNTTEDGKDFIKTEGPNALTSNSDNARNLFFNEKLPKLYMKYFILSFISSRIPTAFSDTYIENPEGNTPKSMLLNIAFHQNSAVFTVSMTEWTSATSCVTTTALFTAIYSQSEMNVTVSNDNGASRLIDSVNTTTPWSLYKLSSTSDYYLDYFTSNFSIKIDEHDFDLIKAFYNGVTFPDPV